MDGNMFLLAPIHRKNALCVRFQVDCRKSIFAVPGLSQPLRVLHAVQAISPHLLVFIIKGQKVIDTIGYFLYMEDQEKQAAVQKELNELAALLDAGIITQEEFEEKKRELLGL